MKQLGVVGVAAFLGLGVAVSCAGDEKGKEVGEAGSAGEAGAPSGGQPSQGGSSTRPSAGEGGQAGAPSSEAGAGGAAQDPAGGAAGASLAQGGAGGAPLDCPAQPGVFNHSCADIQATWAPQYEGVANRFLLDVSQLPFPVASGSARYDVSHFDSSAVFCAESAIQVQGDTVVIPLTTPGVDVTIATLIDFTLTDVCGSIHEFDTSGAPACYELGGQGTAGGVFPLTCAGGCPQRCL